LSEETQRLFKSLLKQLRPLFKENGFRASGQSFVRESNECWVIINFQKSRWAENDRFIFYVNVAACSKRWLIFEGRPVDKSPAHYACDWQWRAENFGPDKAISQWVLSDERSLHSTLGYLKNLFVMHVLPATRTMMTDSELLQRTGGFEYPQMKARAVILAATNQVDALRQIIARLIDTFGSGPFAGGTRKHLELLRSKYPDAMSEIEGQGVQREADSQ
jgi:hypothetical protein